jgi:hypothetical protein
MKINSTLFPKVHHRWFIRSINDGTMKQINLYDFYMLGRAVEPLFEVQEHTEVNDAGFDAIGAYVQLAEAASEGTTLLPATRAAAEDLMAGFGQGVWGRGYHREDLCRSQGATQLGRLHQGPERCRSRQENYDQP